MLSAVTTLAGVLHASKSCTAREVFAKIEASALAFLRESSRRVDRLRLD